MESRVKNGPAEGYFRHKRASRFNSMRAFWLVGQYGRGQKSGRESQNERDGGGRKKIENFDFGGLG